MQEQNLFLQISKKKTLNIDESEIESVISKSTKAIIPVHLAGMPCEMNIISSIAQKYNIKVITALTVSSQKDVNTYKDYYKFSDLILFDGKGYEKSIGFDHELLNSIPISINKMIAGNIKIDDIPTFKNKDFYVDLSGALEDRKGKKDIKKINKLLNFSNL